MKINKLIMSLMVLLMMQSCASNMGAKKKQVSNDEKVFLKINEFMYSLNKRKRLKRKRLSYHLDLSNKYKNILEQTIVDEQTKYGYIVINRSYISALDMEQDIDNQESTLQGVDLVIIAKGESSSIVLKALTIKNENLLTMNVIKLKKEKSNIAYTRGDNALKYYDAIKHCNGSKKSIPTENDAYNIEDKDILFWTSKNTKNSNMAMVYDPKEEKFLEAFRSDTFDVVCVDK